MVYLEKKVFGMRQSCLYICARLSVLHSAASASPCLADDSSPTYPCFDSAACVAVINTTFRRTAKVSQSLGIHYRSDSTFVILVGKQISSPKDMTTEYWAEV